jgi:hypothetical protein
MIVIGIATIVFDLLVYYILIGNFPSSSLPYFRQMILGAFLLGASMLFVFEIVGVNESWCRSVFP